MSYKLGSLFDGSGGFPLAGTLCGIEPMWAAEVEPYPIAVTRSRFPNMKHLGDISKINGAEIEPVDIVSFGSPCQDLSVAGLRRGLKHTDNGDEETTRSGLFMEAVRIIKEMRKATNGEYPRFAIWENVPGAFSSNAGEDFRIVCEELIKIVEPSASMPPVPKNGWNYADSYVGDGWSLAYRVFDAQYWGVPQRRRRIYLVTDFRGGSAREVLFEREGLRGYFAEGRTPWQTTPADAQGSTGADDREGEGNGGNRGRQLDAVIDTLIIDNVGGQAEYAKASPVNGTLRAGAQGLVAYAVENHPADSRVNIDASGKVQTLTSRMGTGGGNVPMVMEQKAGFIDVEMEVAVRKYEVNAALLCECLRDHKAASGFSNKEIAETLDLPLTMVEHWFRQDTYFAIPEPEVWPKLKKLLGIQTDEFDQSIMTFEYKGGNYDMRNRIHIGDTAPTLTCGSGNALHLLPSDPVICLQGNGIDRADTAGCNGRGWKEDTSYTLNTIDRPAVVYAVDQSGGKSGANVHENKAPTLCTTHGGEPAVAYSMGITIQDSRGIGSAVPETMPTLTSGSCPGYQNGVVHSADVYSTSHGGFLVNASKNIANPLTATDYADPSIVAYRQGSFADYVEGEIGTLKASGGDLGGGSENLICERKIRYIVRRLTPTECARLQGFADWWAYIEPKEALTDEEFRFWLEVRNTHARINGKKEQDYTEKQMLTWYNKLYTDSAEYKMWGNGIALPTALYCIRGMAEALAKATAAEEDDWMN